MAPPLILTLALAPGDQERFDALRRQHFPAHRNFLAAHVTLFHKLPGDERDAVLADVRDAARRPPFDLAVKAVRSLGGGVAFGLASTDLDSLCADLAQWWDRSLTPQDRQRFRAHVTVQNKVEPEQARILFERLSASFIPYVVSATGLSVWEYLDGPWAHVETLLFDAHAATAPAFTKLAKPTASSQFWH